MSGDGNRIDQSHTVNIYYGLPPDQPAPNRTDRNEKTLINAVWTEVDDRLRQSLHNAILIRLDMAEQRRQVSRPWDSELRTAEQKAKPLPPETPIAEVFDRRDVGGKLLVLGNPGAGKTTTMLDLAAALVQRANGDPDEPMPVMVNLSSWQNPKQPFADWLLNELKLKYGVSQKLGQTWLSEKKLLPLLDGLDELPPDRQEPAVQGINTWLQSDTGAPRLLVCSRLEEYELYAAKLGLNGAICLSPLTDGQLQGYLASLGMGHLWETLRYDADLLALVRTPLLLSVSILANEDLDRTQWSRLQTTQEQLDYLLDAYIVRRLHEPVKSKEYTPGKQPMALQTWHWLAWLAKQLKAQSEDEFLIEKMQPEMLANRQQKSAYGLIVGLIVGLTFGLTFGLIDGLIDGLLSGLTFGLIGWLIGENKSITLIEDFDLSFSCVARKRFFKEVSQWMVGGLIGGLIVGLILGLIHGLILGLISGLIGGLILGLIGGLFSGLISGLKIDTYNRLIPNQGIIKSAQNILPISFLIFPCGVLISLVMQFARSTVDSSFSFNGLEFDIPRAIAEGIAFAFLIGGGLVSWYTCAQHFALRLVLHRTNAIPWNYARFLNHCTERRLLQRVGGRYRFIHRLVQEHFAAMPLERE